MANSGTVCIPQLRFAPKSNCPVEVPTINLSEYLTSHRICLNAYEERIGVKIPGEQLWQNMCAGFKGGGKGATRKGGTKRQRNESTGNMQYQVFSATGETYFFPLFNTHSCHTCLLFL